VELLRHPIPFPEESLLNYIHRLAEENRCPEGWIYNEIGIKSGTFYKYNINKLKKEEYVLLSKLSGIELNRIENMTFKKYESKNLKFKINLLYSKYCPICLEEEQYHRLYWNIDLVKICVDHKILLLNSCYFCGKPITIYDVIYGKCPGCSTPLKNGVSSHCEDAQLLKLQSKILGNLGVDKYKNYDNELNDKNIKYVLSFHTLMNFVKRNRKDLKRSNLLIRSLREPEELYAFRLLQKIKSDLLNNLPLFLDDINGIIENYIDGSVDRLDYHDYHFWEYISLNPLSIGKYFYDFYFFYVDGGNFDKCLLKYFYENFTFGFCKKRLRGYIINNRFIPVDIACRLFNFKSAMFESYFIKDRDAYYYDLEQIVNFIQTRCFSGIERVYLGDEDENTTTISEAYEIFSKLGLSEFELIDILNNNNIEKHLDIFNNFRDTNNGYYPMDMVILSKKQFFLILLEKALERYKSD
jgi:hypothetical protein